MERSRARMAGRCASLCLLLSALLFQCACKDADEIPHGPYVPPPPPKARVFLGNVAGAALYSLQGEIFVKFDFSVEILNLSPVTGKMTAWRFDLKKDDRHLLLIGEYNYGDSYFRMSAHSSSGSNVIPANSTVVLTVKHEEGAFTPGYPFGQDAPNNMDLYVQIVDDNGYTHGLQANVPFSYSPF